jgi:hypothetical protein
MFLAALLFALLVGFIFTVILGYGFRRRPTGIGFLPLFILIFLVTWAIGAWIAPVGPVAWEVPWLAFLIIGLLFALLVAALVPPQPSSPDVRMKTAGEAEIEVRALGAFFWILIVALAIAVVVRYVQG